VALSGKQFPIAAGEHRATIAEVGASLREYTFAGEPVVAGYREDELMPACDGAVLVPWPNRVRRGQYTFAGQIYQLPVSGPVIGHALHGLAVYERWFEVERTPSSVTLGIDLVPQPGWPFEVRVEVAYAMDATSGLTITASAVNTGSVAAPFGAGFHSYFSLRGHPLTDAVVQVPAARRLVVDDRQIPVADRPVAGTFDLRAGRKLGVDRFDDGFTELTYVDGRGTARVSTPSGGAEIWFDEAYRCVTVFTIEDLVRGIPAVAIEPQTCVPNAYNSGDGLIVLRPGDTWTGSYGIAPLS